MTDDQNKSAKGEFLHPGWSFAFMDLTRIEAGERIVPARFVSENGRRFAARQLIQGDLAFAQNCLTEAVKLGAPDAENVHSRALIFSAVVSYARPFKTGVREIKLEPAAFSEIGDNFDSKIHSHLIAIRDKHIAHSVNELERSETTGVIVGTPETRWRPAGIGVTHTVTIGLSHEMVQQSLTHITAMMKHLDAQMTAQRVDLFQEFQDQFAKNNGKWDWAPFVRWPNRNNASKCRED
jgi:hypothetical protein